MYHRLLEKQIQRYPVNVMPGNEAVQKLLNVISESYYNFDRDKELSEHAFSISENEYDEVNKKLVREIDSRTRSVAKLIDAIKSLEVEENFKNLSDQRIEDVIDHLKIEIEKRKALEIELVKAKEIAEKAATARSEFLSMMSHEIRTPLNAVVGFTYLLLQDKYLPEQEEQLNLLKFSAENLLGLINDILDFNKIESGKAQLEKTSFNLRKLINQMRNSNITKAQDNGNIISVVFDEQIPPVVCGDTLRIGQIINNLVSNAVKFTQNGLIIVKVTLLKQEKENVLLQFSVKDTGIGIAPENQKRIFELFTQASESITRQYGGTGLGLAICNQLLEMMNSRMTLESTPGKGSTFSFILEMPYSQNKEETINELGRPANTDPDLSGTYILLVEDSAVNALVARTFLEKWNAHIDVAENGAQAIEKVRTNAYHVVLMDLHMPAMNGYEACQKILQIKPDLPVIALTASAMLDVRDMAFRIGMKDYIAKPFEPNELYEKIRKNRMPVGEPLS